ncbi:cytosolic nonspecific dipeptidase [Thermoflexales bacterium]|nr:cytosolic nonspecific dipeptidase [Thermoflexales bacterium]
MLNEALQYAQLHRDSFLTELKDFLALPSVSALPEHKPDIQRTAQWLAEKFTSLGLQNAQVNPTPGHPIVTAEWLEAGPDKPTVLIYGHYDVQPIDPIELWHSDPFKAEVRNDYLYARGASDDKGQAFIYAAVLESFMQTSGKLPVNVKLILEGEEEIGGPSLDPFIESHREQLTADVAVISDTHMLRPDLPCLVYALRGLCYIQVEITGPARDLHSGQYGGAIYNPIQALSEMLASLKDHDGHITVPGFYDKVVPLSEAERKILAQAPFNEQEFMQDAGVNGVWGEKGYTTKEQISARPTLEINGIWGGFTGEGSKTVLPAKAFAKISCRLVANQDHVEIAELLSQHLKQIAPPSVKVEIKRLHGGHGALIKLDSKYMRAAHQVLQQVFDHAPIYEREGGSIPVVATFQKTLGIDSIMLGFGLPDDNLHSPNERFYLPNFYHGIETVIRYFVEIGK